MPRPRKVSQRVMDAVLGVAAHANIDVRRRGGAPTQMAIEKAMRAFVRGRGSQEDQKAVDMWFDTYKRSTRYGQLSSWRILEPIRAQASQPSHAASDSTYIPRADETIDLNPPSPADGAGQVRWGPWQAMDRDKRRAFAGFLLEQEELLGSHVLGRLGMVGISRFFDAVEGRSYDGLGYTPQAEIALFAQATAYGVLRLETEDEMRLARRVYLTWKGWTRGGFALVFWDGSSASAGLGRRRAFVRLLAWFIPWLA